MAKPKFELEDFVCLKIGSIKMCIEEIRVEEYEFSYKCIWFDGAKACSKICLEHSLQLWEDEPDDILDLMADL